MLFMRESSNLKSTNHLRTSCRNTCWLCPLSSLYLSLWHPCLRGQWHGPAWAGNPNLMKSFFFSLREIMYFADSAQSYQYRKSIFHRHTPSFLPFSSCNFCSVTSGKCPSLLSPSSSICKPKKNDPNHDC